MTWSTRACSCLCVVAAVVAASAAEKKLHVLPVVVMGGAPGAEGSFWQSEVRVLARSPNALKVSLLWAAGRDGGGPETPGESAYWELPPYDASAGNPHRMLILPSGALTPRKTSGTHLALGLEVEGDADVFVRNANTMGQWWLPTGSPEQCCLPGSGQLIKAATEYLHGESVIPWTTAGTEAFRTNVGLINPTDQTLRAQVRLVAMAPLIAGPPFPFPIVWFDTPQKGYLPTLVVDLPPWGWRQLNDVFRSLNLCDEHNVCAPSPTTRPSYVRIVPEGDGPYLAYASVIYSPTNDPEFIWAEPGGMKPPLPDLPK